MLRLLNSANGNDIVINIIEANEWAPELKKITRKGKKASECQPAGRKQQLKPVN